jgi:cobalt/nickel transport system ATP-binding protein
VSVAHTHSHAPRAADEVARVSCVRHTYEDGTAVALCGLDVVAKRGQRVAVLGPNGSGKTTLLYHLLGLLRPDEGEVRVFDTDPSRDWRSIRQRIGVVLQNVDEQILAPTVYDDVAFSPRQYGLPEAQVAEMTQRALGLLGIEDLAERVPHNLSGGEKRKVALAGALVMEPELLVLDEPFEGLDPASRSSLVALMARLSAERGVTVVTSMHDIDWVYDVADYCYVLAAGGEVVLRGTPQDVFAQPELLTASNIRPPVLSELFRALALEDPGAPGPELSVAGAAKALLGWKHGS